MASLFPKQPYTYFAIKNIFRLYINDVLTDDSYNHRYAKIWVYLSN